MSGMKSIFVVGIEGTSKTIEVGDIENTTVTQFKQLLKDRTVIPSDMAMDDIRLLFAGKELREKRGDGTSFNLSDYNLQNRSTVHTVLRLPGGSDPPATEQKVYPVKANFAIKFTTAKDVLDPFSSDGDDGPIRAKMSCGHAVTPDALTGWCRSLIDQKQFAMYCPGYVDEAQKKQCRKEWPYEEVRQMALLNESEMQHFESKLSELASGKFFDAKECPECRTWVERKDQQNLRVICRVCSTKKGGGLYEFCWNCCKPWSGPTTSSVKCGADDCNHPSLAIIQNCARTIDLVEGKIKEVPAFRSCPTCGCLAEHSTEACKYLICPRCRKEYCFACLLLKGNCLKTSTWFTACTNPVAPKQTTIALWIQPRDAPRQARSTQPAGRATTDNERCCIS